MVILLARDPVNTVALVHLSKYPLVAQAHAKMYNIQAPVDE